MFTLAIVGNPNCGKTSSFNALTQAFDRDGYDAAIRLLSAHLRRHRAEGVLSTEMDQARFAAMQGDAENTMRWLQTALEGHQTALGMVRVEPQWDFLRGDPRFQALAWKVALPEPAGVPAAP